MPTKEQTGIRPIESPDDFWETRLEAIGYIFHGSLSPSKSKAQPPAGTNLLHFARCPKLDKINDSETKIWFRSVKVAHRHLDEEVGTRRWKWCKLCEKEITQRVLDEV